ncbi:MAG TPA: nucleotidyl transferase AbiEii/AbiGii toxin family protein [Candidatus Elarobacter sp.]|nr:nucleotidyl transferase AbiEii/AbiGii toxin family protein [Candidatus Elarobacter sp.]HEV2740161.1 nucleotidyl transferase AbiEii/AbiGii toxin family protein [Candidatus Elarobacter sp.]
MASLARERNTTLARVRHLVGFGIICETLTEAVARGVIPIFFVKGGVAIELRLGLRARATKDLDIGLCAPSEELVTAFDRALEVGYPGFRLRRRGEARLLDNGARTFEVRIEHLGRAWATVDVDLAAAASDIVMEDVPTTALHDVGLGTARSVPCLTLTTQIAQKIHALTESEPRGRSNTRARDVLDVLLLMRRLAPPIDEIRKACARVFSERGTHEWPVHQFTFPAHWSTVIRELAQDVGHKNSDPDEIQQEFNRLLARIDGVSLMVAPTAELNARSERRGVKVRRQVSAASVGNVPPTIAADGRPSQRSSTVA